MKVKAYRTLLDGCRYPYVVAENGNYICDGRKTFMDPLTIYDFCETQLNMCGLTDEYAYVFALDSKGKLMCLFEVGHGSSHCSAIGVRELFQKLILVNAAGFVFAHNHPSGDPTPSKEDGDLTEKIKQAGKVLDVQLFDHIVIGDRIYYSFSEEKRI